MTFTAQAGLTQADLKNTATATSASDLTSPADIVATLANFEVRTRVSPSTL